MKTTDKVFQEFVDLAVSDYLYDMRHDPNAEALLADFRQKHATLRVSEVTTYIRQAYAKRDIVSAAVQDALRRLL